MDANLIYINLDGFGKYYYDDFLAKGNNLPAFQQLLLDGTLFEHAYTGIPSITFPMQAAILSGCPSGHTGNCFHYWDREKKKIISCGRFNRAETFGEVLKKHHIPCLSIQQFAEEDKGCAKTTPDNLYVQPGGNYQTRFDILFSVLKNRTIALENTTYTFKRLPNVIMLYADDFDTLGHNPPYIDAKTETQRVSAVQMLLKSVDDAIGELTSLLKQLHMFENTYLLITTDHGMVHYQGKTALLDIARHLERNGFGPVYLGDEAPNVRGAGIRLLTTGIQCQLYFLENPSHALEEKVVGCLRNIPVVERVLNKQELKTRGTDPRFADILISPKEGYHFGPHDVAPGKISASHDSLHEKAQHIYAYLKGPGIKKDYRETASVSNIDFFPTLCALLGLPPMQQATGRVLDSIFETDTKVGTQNEN